MRIFVLELVDAKDGKVAVHGLSAMMVVHSHRRKIFQEAQQQPRVVCTTSGGKSLEQCCGQPTGLPW